MVDARASLNGIIICVPATCAMKAGSPRSVCVIPWDEYQPSYPVHNLELQTGKSKADETAKTTMRYRPILPAPATCTCLARGHDGRLSSQRKAGRSGVNYSRGHTAPHHTTPFDTGQSVSHQLASRAARRRHPAGTPQRTREGTYVVTCFQRDD
jgi:hypothetical protein